MKNSQTRAEGETQLWESEKRSKSHPLFCHWFCFKISESYFSEVSAFSFVCRHFVDAFDSVGLIFWCRRVPYVILFFYFFYYVNSLSIMFIFCFPFEFDYSYSTLVFSVHALWLKDEVFFDKFFFINTSYLLNLIRTLWQNKGVFFTIIYS